MFHIDLLLLPAFNINACMAFVDAFRVGNYLQGETLFEWRFLSLETQQVSASNGVTILTDVWGESVLDQSEAELLVVNSSWAPEQFTQRSLKIQLGRLAGTGKALVGLDTGAFVLAYAGLLDGYQACVHPEHSAAFMELFPDSQCLAKPWVIDRQRMCAGGGGAAAELAIEIIRRHQDADFSEKIAHYLQLSSGDSGNYQGHYPDVLHEALILMQQNIEEPIAIAELAALLHCHERQLNRICQRYLGTSAKRQYLNYRLERARRLVTQTSRSMTEIAAATGFSSIGQFSKAYKGFVGQTPSAHRVAGRVPFEMRLPFSRPDLRQ